MIPIEASLPPARLYIIGTPIGNLEDLTWRAKRILSSVSVIACEDTRVTKKLLTHYKISTPTISLHQHSDSADIGRLINRVVGGENVAYVTDAGMPAIADPGGLLVATARRYNLRVEVVPGPTALTSALAVSGFPADSFLFLGFLPHKKGRQTLFKRIAATDETVVLYESPHRLMKTLESLKAAAPDRPLAVCRELTKIHESVITGTAAEAFSHFLHHQDQVRGEFVVVVSPKV